MRIEKLVIPTPFPVGPINIYLVLEDPLTLIDTGPKTDEALSALRYQLRELGLVTSDLRRIVLTHTHEDHCGLAGTLQRESGARVYVHEWEYRNISLHRETRVNRDLLARAGVPGDQMEEMAGRYELIHRFADAVEDVEAFQDEAEFVFDRGALRAVHTPGHTPGSCCLFRESSRLMLTGDTILKSITPNPILNPDPIDPRRRFPSLGEYLVSLARIRELHPTVLRTAHGDDVTDYEEHFHRLVRHIETRLIKVVKMVPCAGVSAWELSLQLFPNVRSINRFLAVSETIANLDLAVAEGRLKSESRDFDVYYS